MRIGVLVVLAGCGRLFNLDPVDDDRSQDDATVASDSLPGDAPGDGLGDALDLAASCPSYSLTYGASRYRLIDTYQSIVGAFTDCEDDHSGYTHLAVLESSNELTAVISLLLVDDQNHLVGALQRKTATVPGAEWLWITGETVATNAWSSSEPNDTDNDESDHAQQVAHVQRQFSGLIDSDNNGSFLAICECDGKTIAQSARDTLVGL